jgi:hypothetical protein
MALSSYAKLILYVLPISEEITVNPFVLDFPPDNFNQIELGTFKQTTPKSHRIFFKATDGVVLNQFRTSQF